MDKALKSIHQIREQLDSVDQQIQTLLNLRAQLALEIGHIKKNNGGEACYRPEREAQILRTIMQRNTGPLANQVVTQIFRTLMTACLALQQKIKVAFLGPEGTFSHAAALKHFGMEIDTEPCVTIAEVLQAVHSGRSHYGVVPIENSTTGVINATLTALMTTQQKICGEIILPIHQHLLRVKNAEEPIQRIYSHEQSLLQCKNWLANNFPNAEKIPVSSNSMAAKLAQQDSHAAAIAGEMAASLYELEKIASNIEDQPQNKTRFLILGHQNTKPSGADKTTLLLTTPHTPGALIKLIQPFSDCGINITWIESRPYQHQTWSYLFFLDIEGHQEDSAVQKALEQLSTQPVMFTLLGSYPQAIL